MKKNEISQCLIIHCRCNFSHMIFGTYNMVFSCHFQREYNKTIGYPIIINGNIKEKGSKFIIKRADLNMYIFYEIKEIIMTDYFASFKYHIYKTIPETYEYDYILEVRYINEDQCDFFVCFVFGENIYYSEKEMLEELKFRKNLYKNIENSLGKFEIFKLATVYTTIKSKIEVIFDILQNMKLINKYCHLCGDKINYKGEILKVNSLIHLIEYKDKTNIESTAKVRKLNFKKDETTKECIIEFVFQKNKNNISYFYKTKIMIIVYEYDGLCSFYIFYFFHNIQKSLENLMNFIKIKNKELMKFKKIVENYNKKSSNKMLTNKDSVDSL